jgi:hypothetical protein
MRIVILIAVAVVLAGFFAFTSSGQSVFEALSWAISCDRPKC